jgi:hypothetical protein
MTRLFAFGLAIALALSATAASAHERRPSPDRYVFKSNGGCPPYYYRGAGGNCVYYGAERPVTIQAEGETLANPPNPYLDFTSDS